MTAYSDGEPKMRRPRRSEEQQKFDAKWTQRIKIATEERDEKVMAGDRVMRYVRGENVTFEGLERETEHNIKVVLPVLKALVDSIVPAVLARDPSAVVRPSDPQDEAKVKLSKACSELLTKSAHEHDMRGNARMAVKEALIYPIAGWEASYSSERGLPRLRWYSIKKLLWDTNGDGMPQSLRWAAVEFTLPIEAARVEYKARWLAPDASSYNPKSSEEVETIRHKFRNTMEREDICDQKKLIRIWWRGDIPSIDDVSIESANNSSRYDKEEGYNRLIVYDPDSERVISDEPWPFVLDHDSLPIIFIAPEVFPGEPASIGTFEPLIPLQNVINWLYSMAADSIKNSAQEKGFYEPKRLTEEKIDQLREPRDRVYIPIDGFESELRGDVTRIMGRIENGGLSSAMLQGFSLFNQAFDMVSQNSDLRASTMAGIDKVGVAQLTESRATNRMAVIADQVEEWIAKSYRILLQIAMSVMRPSDVAKWVGNDVVSEMVTVEVPDSTGQMVPMEVEVSYWPAERPSAGDIRRETDVRVEPGSMQKQSVESMVNSEIAVFDRAIAAIGDMDARLRQAGKFINTDAMLRFYNHFFIRFAELQGKVNTDIYLLRAGDILDIPQPEPEPTIPDHLLNRISAEVQ